MDAKLKECPFCGGVPTFTSIEEMDDRRYAQMGLECCATMHTTIPWPRWSDLGPAKLSNELKDALTADWNKRPAAIAPPVAAGSVDTAAYISALQATVTEQSKRAEKAEAELAVELERVQDYYTRWRCERENPTNTHRLDTWQAACGKARAERDKAEARVKELEAAYQEVLRRCL